MNLKTLIALAVAGAFAVPMAASAADDSLVIAQAGGTGSASGSAASGGAGDYAGNRMEPHPRGFDRLDTNHDGYVSRDEASKANDLNTRFSEMDRDNDGKLSRQEYNAFEADQRAQGHGPGQQRTHRGAAGATTSREGDVNAGAAKAPNKQPSENPRSETDTTK